MIPHLSVSGSCYIQNGYQEISKIVVCCVYLPPSQSEIDSFYDYLYNCYDKLCMKSPNSTFIVLGDFNPMSNGFRQS
jgi:exonuclease III